MWKPLIKCSIVGGIVVFLWYTVSWIVLPWHKPTLTPFTNEQQVASCLMANAPRDGIYVLPMAQSQNQTQASDNNWDSDYGSAPKKMPFVFANIVRQAPSRENMTKNIVVGVVNQIIGAFIATWLLLHAKAMKYSRRVGFITVLGLFLGFLSSVTFWNWWAFPAGFSLLSILDPLIAWFFGGLVIGKLIK